MGEEGGVCEDSGEGGVSDFVAVVSSELSVVSAGAGVGDTGGCSKSGALASARTSGGSGDRRLRVGRVA